MGERKEKHAIPSAELRAMCGGGGQKRGDRAACSGVLRCSEWVRELVSLVIGRRVNGLRLRGDDTRERSGLSGPPPDSSGADVGATQGNP